MKKIILFLLIVLGIPYLQSQTPPWREPANLDAYVGVWRYANDSVVFKIKLRKGYKRSSPFFETMGVNGGYYINKKGIVENYLEISADTITDKNFDKIPISCINAQLDRLNIDGNKLHFSFNDIRLDKFTVGGMIYLLSPTRIRWTLKEEEEADYLVLPPEGFSVPTNIIMTKVQ